MVAVAIEQRDEAEYLQNVTAGNLGTLALAPAPRTYSRKAEAK